MNVRMSSSSHRLHSKYLGLTIDLAHYARESGECMGQAAAAALLLGPYMHEEISEWLQGGSCSQDLHA